MPKLTIAAIVAAISSCENWQELMEIKNAIDKRLRIVEFPKLNAAQVRATFKKGMKVTLVGLRDPSLNGLEGEVIEVAQTRLVIDVPFTAGSPYRTRIPAACAIPHKSPES